MPKLSLTILPIRWMTGDLFALLAILFWPHFMPRILITLCLLPALLLTQWLSVGQCSCVCAECDHGGAAHVHVASVTAKLTKHGCGHQHCCQHRVGQVSVGQVSAGPQHGSAVVGRSTHPVADIVYLPHSLFGGWLKQATALSRIDLSGNLACPLPRPVTAASLNRRLCQSQVEGQRRSTFRPGADAPLYLRTLTLLI